MASRGTLLHVGTLSGWHAFTIEPGGIVRASGRDLAYWSASAVATDPRDPAVIYVGTERSGLFVSRDAGATWSRPTPGVPVPNLFALLALSDGSVLAGTWPVGLFRRGPDPAAAWTEVDAVRGQPEGWSFPPNPGLGPRLRCLAADPGDGARLYAGIEVGGVLGSDDGGRSWRPLNEGLGDPDVHELVCSRSRAGLMVAACGEGVYASESRGSDWHTVTPPGGRTYGMVVAEDGEGVVYVGLARRRPNGWVGPGGADGALFASRDAGASWSSLLEGSRGGIMALAADPEGRGVYAGLSTGELLRCASDARPEEIARDLPCVTALSAVAA